MQTKGGGPVAAETHTTLTPDTPVRYLKGVGPKTAERFEKLGIVTLADLLCHYPRRYLDFSKPYYFPMNAIISKKDAKLDTLDKLKGKKAGASMGTTYCKALQEAGGIEVVELDSTPLVVQDIINGRLDAGMFDSAQASVFVKENPQLEMHVIKAPITLDDTFAIAFPKDSKNAAEVNKILAEMRTNGELHKILVAHLGETQAKQYEDVVAKLDIAK